MTSRYRSHHPEHYPIAWLSAAKLAAKELDSEKWVSVDWARSEHGAVARMKRLRAFRDGIKLNAFTYPEFGELLTAGYDLTFRKLPSNGVWDVQLRWKAADKGQVIAPVKELLK